MKAFINPANYTRTVNPYQPIWDELGDYVYDRDIEGAGDRVMDFNLIEERENTNYFLKNLAVKPQVSLEYKPFSWLKLNTQLGLQLENSKSEKMAQEDTYYVRKYRESSRYKQDQYFLPEGGIIQNWDSDMSQYHWKIQAEFTKTWVERHEVDVMAGYEMRGDKTTEIHAKGFGFDPRTLTTKPVVFPDASYANSALFKQYTKSEYENRYISYYMTGSYMYDNRYTFFGSLRYDGSNLFGVAKKYKYLPLWSVSGAWNINREEFMSQVDWLTNLKLRVSYGVQGNVDKNTSPFIMGAWGNVSILPDTNEPNIEVSSPPNQNLRWEKTKNWNFGWDMGVFKNRLTFSVDAYKRISNDLLGHVHYREKVVLILPI